MKTLIATLLATAAGASFAAAPTAALNHDPATYRNLTQKAESEYRAATAKCDARSGNDKDICMAEARLVRIRTEADALAKYNNTAAGRARARTSLADAEYDLAKAKCDAKSGADKDSCMDNAKSVHTAALADAKADRTATTTSNTSSGASGGGSQASGGGLVTGTDTRDPAKAAAVDKCAQMGADAKTGCLVETKPSAVRENAADAASKTRDTAATAGDKVKAAAATVAEKTKEVAHSAVEKTKEAGSTVAQKTDNAMDRAGDKTTDNAADKTRDTAGKTRIAASDTAITTKVKAGLVKEPNLDSLGIHVETEKGVVMLSGFVNSKEEADKAVKVAKGVEGVSSVKSAIKVK